MSFRILGLKMPCHRKYNFLLQCFLFGVTAFLSCLISACGQSDSIASQNVYFELDWDPDTGRGSISQTLVNGDRYVLCLQCGYNGYTGGLWIGNLDGSGFEYFPAEPANGFESLNIFCAQDESLILADSGLEYSNGWSENIGEGPDGEKLEYISGKILENSEKKIVLKSINQGGCIEETRYLQWSAGEQYFIIAAHFRNICKSPVVFDFWTGDDPWIGEYKTSEGDVGWTPHGFIRKETELNGWGLEAIGMVDLGDKSKKNNGNSTFSGVANFMSLPSSQEPPQYAYIANSFAHNTDDISDQLLNNKTMTAYNLGWGERRLEPDDVWRVAYALGRAENNSFETTPSTPEISEIDWEFDKKFSDIKDNTNSDNVQPVRFVGERIILELDPPYLKVTGDYVFRNSENSSLSISMFYPFPTDSDSSYPDKIDIKGSDYQTSHDGLNFHVSIGPYETQKITISYRQKFNGLSSYYILTTTAHWGNQLDWGIYQASWPNDIGEVDISLDNLAESQADGRTYVDTRRINFMPKDEFRLTLAE